MKALDDMSDEEQDIEVVSSIINTIVNQTVTLTEEQDNDEIGLAQRIEKRSVNMESDIQQMKRLRSNPVNASLSV
jgi:tetrahydromethanopterin S-methyltransferase subunit H